MGEHSLRVVQAVADQGPPSKALAWAALLHDVAKPATRSVSDRIRFHGHEAAGGAIARAIGCRLRLGGELTEAIATLVSDHLRLDPIKRMRLSTLKRLLRRDDLEDLLALHKADCLGSHGDLELYAIARARQAEFAQADAAAGLHPEALLDGADLISWGYVPGPRFKEMLTLVEDEQLEGRLTDKAAARAFVEGRFTKD